MFPLRTVRRLLPGLLLCLAITLAALALEHVEEAVFGRAWLEALVLAILLGTAVRSLWRPGDQYGPGIGFGAKTLLEVAVLLLGLSVSFAALLAVGPGLLLGIAALVVVAIGASYLIGRGLGLPRRMAILVGCGNSICGNSAIAAVAPVIGATGKDVAASIAFTAVLGVVVVLTLPLLVTLWGLTETQYGVVAGLTVYAVPQVLAATVPVGMLSAQVGTLVKLVRVLMLGPAVLLLSLIAAREGDAAAQRKRPPLHRMVPWFIIGFLLLAGLRSAGLVPQAVLAPAAAVADLLTVLAMAALGLGVDVRSVARAGARVTAAAVLSLLLLLGMSLVLIRVLHIA
ncbi:YeiH family protein [Siccirubricoccus sp. G192]|uniref:YeiH family protein n=1 Tax=Siccirubricoccus sp. G192 TaxID=2849651 RepID=UPI001C2C7E7A|nr:putative sulfate exporter family transporter [Siccirubricoccus sp. G192]MBV1800207.1 putative sulfate exporter family transporter [Siccirubricoccus sp. G192]